MATKCQVFRNDNNEIERVEAPNGNESILYQSVLPLVNDNKEEALRVWAQVYTPSFKQWFVDSKVVDANGEPLVVYRSDEGGSPSIFSATEQYNDTTGVYFYDNKSAAIRYGREHQDDYQISPFFLKVEKPLDRDYNNKDRDRNIIRNEEDGFILRNSNDNNSKDTTEIVVFESNQIKSVFNNGQFSQQDDNIYLNVETKGFKNTAASQRAMRGVGEFLKRIGVDVEVLKRDELVQFLGKQGMDEKFGSRLGGIAALTDALIGIVEGKENVVLAEEAAHFAEAIIRQVDPTLHGKLMADITKFDIYSRTFSQYSKLEMYRKDGKPDVVKLKREAIGKLLAEVWVGVEDGGDSEAFKLTAEKKGFVQRVIDFFKRLFGRVEITPFKPYLDIVSAIRNGTFEGTAADIRGEELMLNIDPTDRQKELLDMFDATSRRIINKPIGDEGDNAYFDGERKISKRASQEAKKRANIFGKDKVPTPTQANKNKYALMFGKQGHQDLEYLLTKYVGEDGMVSYSVSSEGVRTPIAIKTGEYIPLMGREEIYNRLEEYIVELLASYPDGTIFRTEQTLYNEDKDLVGTTDLIAVMPDGMVDILDWKFTNLDTRYYDDVKWWDEKYWKAQMQIYRQLMMDGYGVKLKDFRKTQMIPIILEYGLSDNFQDEAGFDISTYYAKSIEMGELNLKVGDKDYLIPVPADAQSSGNPEVDKLIGKMRNLYDQINKMAVTDGRKDLKSKELNSIKRAIRHLQVLQSVGPLLDSIDVSIKDSQLLLDDMKGRIYTQQELNDLSTRILLKLTALGIYKDMDISFDEIFHGQEGGEDVRKRINDTSISIKRTMNSLNDALGEAANAFAMRDGVIGLLAPEPTVGLMEANFNTLSTQTPAALQVLSRVNTVVKQRIELERKDEAEKIKALFEGLSAYGKESDKTLQELTKMLKQDGKNKLIKQYQKAFYEELDKAIEAKDSQWMKDNIDIPAYEEWLKGYAKDKLQEIDTTTYSANDEENEERKQLERQRLEEQVNTKRYSQKYLIRRFPLAKWESGQYKQISAIQPLKNIYSYIQELNQRAADEDYISTREQRTFLPYMYKSFIEQQNLGGDFSVLDSILSAITIDENTSGYGQYNALLGEMENTIPIYFTKEIENIGEVSENLFVNLAAYAGSLIRYKHKKEVDGLYRGLYWIEKNKGSLRTNKYGRLETEKDPVTGEVMGNIIVPTNDSNAKIFFTYLKNIQYGQAYAGDTTGLVMGSIGSTYNNMAKGFNKTVGKEILPYASEDGRQVSLARLLESVNKIFTLKAMGFNPFTAATVFFGGNFQGIINAGTYYTAKEFEMATWQLAQHKLFSGNHQIDLALMKELMPVSEDLQRQIDKLTILKFDPATFSDLLLSMMRTADHSIQYMNYLAFMNNTIVMDGKIVNARDWYRSSPEYAGRLSLPEAERIALKKGFDKRVQELINEHGIAKKASIVDGKLSIEGVDLRTEDSLRYRALIQAIARNATANVSPENETGFRMTVLGRTASLFRNWIPRSVQIRGGKLKTNSETDELEWGRWRMLINLFRSEGMKSITKIRALTSMNDEGVQMMERFLNKTKEQYKERTGKDLEVDEAVFADLLEKNIISQGKELMTLMILFSLIGGLSLIEPDDDDTYRTKNAYKLTYRMLDKLKDEVFFYYNPLSIQQLLNGNLMPSMSLFTDIYKIFSNLTKEVYGDVTGDEEMSEKAQPLKYIFKATPILSQTINFIPLFSEDIARSMDIRIPKEANIR